MADPLPRARHGITLGPDSPLLDDEGAFAGAVNASRVHRAGASLETMLDHVAAIYRRRGFALVSRGHPPVKGRPPMNGRPGTLRYAGHADVDYIGWVDLGGVARPVAFDAKSWTGQASYRLLPRTERKDRHQIAFLADWARGGGVAFLFVADPDLGWAWALGVDTFPLLLAGAAVSLRAIARGTGVVTHHQPAIPAATADAIARGAVPWDWRVLAAKLPGAWPPGVGVDKGDKGR